MLLILSLLCFLHVFISSILCCSQITHIEICERSAAFFEVVSSGVDYNRLISRNADAFQAGASFPDAFYPSICFGGQYHQVAEDTHWTPYIKAAVDYIRRQYTRPWSKDTERLVVFLLAIIQHQVGDVNWHSLGIDQGFLEVMGHLNYNGSFSRAHSAGDFGGDVLNTYELNLDYVGKIIKWYVPSEDLLNIYTELYGESNPMTIDVIENCTMLLFLGRLGESIGAIDMLYPLYAADSPFLLGSLNNYFLGGIDDMATWSQNVWRRTIKMLDNGSGVCTLPENPIYIRCDGETDLVQPRDSSSESPRVDQSELVERWLSSVMQFVDESSVTVRRTGRGVEFSVDENMKSQMAHQRLKRSLTRDVSECRSEDVEPPEGQYQTRLKYSRLGEHITSGDINNDGFVDAIISAPLFSSSGNYQQGRVYILYGTVNGLPLSELLVETSSDQILDGLEKNERFGTSSVVIDLNADGLNDLVVSAPSTDSPTLDYRGRVYVYLSSAPGQLLPSQPSLTIRCTERYCNLGWMLSVGQVNPEDDLQDLILGSPFCGAGGKQRGMLGVIYSSRGITAGLDLTEENFDVKLTGQQDYQWFGYSAASLKFNNGQTVLAVGAPAHRICYRSDCVYDVNDVQSVGKVMAYSILNGFIQSVSELIGSDEFEQLGGFVGLDVWGDEDTPVLIVSSISAGLIDADTINGRDLIQTGVVHFYSITDSGIVDSESLLTLNGNRDLSRFGSDVLLFKSPVDGSQNVLVSAPFRSEDLREDREGGRVYLFNAFDHEQQHANRTLGIFMPQSRFGSSMALIPTQQNGMQLLVGAEHFTPASSVTLTTNRLVGTVGVFQL